MIIHIFRFVLLISIGIVPLFFMEIEHKLDLMIGWIVGVTLAYIVGFYISNKRKKRNNID